jgi:S-adenosylmethionine hydrolase
MAVYAYTAARLAAGVISFEQVGMKLPNEVNTDSLQQAVKSEILQKEPSPFIQYSNIWTNISGSLFNQLGLKYGDAACGHLPQPGKKYFLVLCLIRLLVQ